MNQRPKITGTTNSTAKTGGSYGAGSLTAGNSTVSAATSSTPTAGGNNPRIDLLHNAGSNNLAKSEPKVTPLPQATSVPIPAPVPNAQPTPTPLPASPRARKSKKGLVAIIFVLLLLAASGGGVWWWLNRSVETATEPPPASVALSAVDPTKLAVMNAKKTAIATGGATGGTNITFVGTLETSANSGSAVAEIEIQPIGTPFTNEPTYTGEPTSAGGSDISLSVVVASLSEGSYHWQMRTVVEDKKSNWVTIGDGTKPDFKVDATPPPPPTLTTFEGKSATGSLVTENAKPVFTGTTEPGAELVVTIDQQKFTATANEKGEWQVTPSSEIAKGNYSVTIVATDTAGNAGGPLNLTLAVNAPATAQQTPPPAATPAPAPEPAPAPAPAAAAEPNELAKTGDPTSITKAAAIVLLGISLTCIVLMRRYGWR